MKKFLKFCFVTAVIFILLGLIIAVAATAAGGGKQFVEMIQNGDLTINADDFIEIFNEGQDVLTGDVPLMEIPSENIKKLDINLGGGEFYIRNSSDEKFYIKAEHAEKLQIYAEDEELYLKALRSRISKDETKVYLYIPQADYDKADVSLGAGMLIFEDTFSTDDFVAEVDAGQMIIENITCRNLDVNVGAGEFVTESVSVSDETQLKVGAGHIEMNGTAGVSLDIKCSMGGVELNLDNSETDFNYEIECIAGSVEIGAKEFAALSKEKRIDNQASKEMDIECSMGAVILDFNK